MLTAEGLALSGCADASLNTLVAFARHAADVYLGQDEPPVVTQASIRHSLSMEDRALHSIETMLTTESFLISSGSRADVGWTYEVSPQAAHFRDCADINGYLHARREIVNFEIFAEAPLQTPVRAHLPGVANEALVSSASLHPAILTTTSPLLLDGHYSQAVLEACKALAKVIRDRTGLEALDGTELADRAASLLLYSTTDDRTGQNVHEGTKLMIRGVMLSLRNPAAHRIEPMDRAEATEAVALISFLARRIENASLAGDVEPGR